MQTRPQPGAMDEWRMLRRNAASHISDILWSQPFVCILSSLGMCSNMALLRVRISTPSGRHGSNWCTTQCQCINEYPLWAAALGE